MMKNIFLAILLLGTFNAQAQRYYGDYDWAEKASLSEIDESLADEGEILLLDKTVIEYDYNDDEDLTEYLLEHSIRRVNSDEAIEENNRIYLPLGSSSNIIKQKARVITPSGKVIELKESDIQEAEEDGQKYQYFALRGLEKGSEIEYLLLMERRLNYRGAFNVLQSNIPKQNVSFEIIAPWNLVFAYKGYNGFGEMVQDTTDEETFHLIKEVDFIPKLKSEPQSVYRPNLMQVAYKLDENLSSGSKDIVNYSEFSQDVTSLFSAELNKKELKGVQKLIKDNKWAAIGDLETKVRKIESHMKTNFVVVDYDAKELMIVESILSNKAASELGIMRLNAAVFNEMGIDYEVVVTTNRGSLRFDEEFESYSFLDEFMFYLPELDMYMVPADAQYCLGLPPAMWSDNYGLFIEQVKLGEFVSGIGTIKYIKPLDHTDTKDDMLIQVTATDFPEIKVHYEKSTTGYYAHTFQPLYHFVDEETKEEIDKAQIEWISEDIDIDKVEVKNVAYEDFGNKPLVVESDFTSKAFVESAGNKYIFKIGELIGPQMEMYQEEERKLPVEQSNERFYHRVIEFTVPDGYTVSNLDALNFDITHEEDGEMLMAFVSEYTLEDGLLRVVIDEYYTQNKLPVELYEAYRKVINAAADFNKVVLYLEKG